MREGLPLRVAVVGGFGRMASPMAKHWASGRAVQVLRVHDRGKADERHEACREAWASHGARLVSTLDELIGAGQDLDGVFVCCGKNGDDLPIIALIAALLARRNPGAFICHMSTLSAGFVAAASRFCADLRVRYVNYPLTGGPSGAEAGKLLILASGDRALYDQLVPALQCLGTPRYFGERAGAAAEVKFIGHIMVFNGLIGICAAAAVHAECFLGGRIGGAEQSEFFDFLNNGAGGTRQWDVILSAGVRNDVWDAPFLLAYGAVDAIYTAQLAIERETSLLTVEPVITAALAFSFVLNEVGPQFATHSIVREMVRSRRGAFDQFILRRSAPRGDVRGALDSCIRSLPASIQASVALNVGIEDLHACARQLGETTVQES